MINQYSGSCHCGEVEFTFKSKNLVEIWKCNCSICVAYNYEHLFIKHHDFNLIKGHQKLFSYEFGSRNANHLFCRVCGIKSYYQPRSHPDMYSINLRCVKNPPKVDRVVEFDGINFEESIKEV